MLAGAHLLTVPTLAEKAGSITSQTDEVCKQLAVVLGYRKEAVDQLGGIEYLMEDYLEKRGILRDDEPLTYCLSVDSYERVTEYFYGDEEINIPEDQKDHYIGLFFVSNTFTEDLGGDLEEIEHEHPGLGAWLLDRFDISPCNILTPAKILDQADFLLNWGTMDEDGYVGDEEAITKEKFEEYFPDWAYKRFNDPPPDFSRWTQLTELHKREMEYFSVESNFPHRRHDRELIMPEGTDMFSGVIGWTKGRNEIERDIGYRVCNDLYHDMMYGNGANPGCMQFEFVMNRQNAGRNILIADLLDKFIRYLVALGRVISDIGQGDFR